MTDYYVEFLRLNFPAISYLGKFLSITGGLP